MARSAICGRGISTLALAAPAHAIVPIARVIPLGARDDADSDSATHRPSSFGLHELAAAAEISGDRNWSIGHAQSNLGAEMDEAAIDPETYLTSNTTRGPAVGTALAEHSLGGHDFELGLPLPDLPSMHITAERYWWGDRTFVQAVQGYRVGLSYDINRHLRFECGRSEDQVHGVAGFLGLKLFRAARYQAASRRDAAQQLGSGPINYVADHVID